MSLEFLQQYWWFLLSVLGAFLVFLMFVQGGQSMLIHKMNDNYRERIISTIAHRWELTFTTLVTFGGAFFASFPLFYSTSFGGAYWVWMLILFGFILQAVSYKYRLSDGNIFGRRVYDSFLVINGIMAPTLIGGAVGTFFFGSEFTIDMDRLTADPLTMGNVISNWGEWHGLEVLTDWRVVAFGLAVFVLTRLQAQMWFINQTDDDRIASWSRKHLIIETPIFIILLAVTLTALFTTTGYESISQHEFCTVEYKYLKNLIEMPAAAASFLIGTLLLVGGILLTIIRERYRRGIWLTGTGTILVVLALFWIAGYNNTPYYPSTLDAASSLTIYNSSSTQYTLRTMSYVSLAIPFVLAYIVWVWRKLVK